MRKALSLLWVIALSACAGGGMQSQSAIPSTSSLTHVGPAIAGTTWNVQTGASHDSYAIQDLDFYPNSITIDAGDSIVYRVASGSGGDAHTVSFVPSGQPIPSPGDPNDLNPAGGTAVDGSKFVNSGILFGGQTFKLTFTKAGTYKILCLFHEPAMASTVIVQKAGTHYPHDAQFYLTAGEQDEWVDFHAGEASVALFPFKPYGTTIAAGIDPVLTALPPTQPTVLRFFNTPKLGLIAKAGNFTVKAGTVLTFMNLTSNEPHTVTIMPAGQNALPPIPPDPALNFTPAPGITIFNGSAMVNSGSFFGGQAVLIKFITPGTYFYGCLYHDNSRMHGFITVTP